MLSLISVQSKLFFEIKLLKYYSPTVASLSFATVRRVAGVRHFKYTSDIVPPGSFGFLYSFLKSGQSLVLMRPPQPAPWLIKFLCTQKSNIAISEFLFVIFREIEENPSLQNIVLTDQHRALLLMRAFDKYRAHHFML